MVAEFVQKLNGKARGWKKQNSVSLMFEDQQNGYHWWRHVQAGNE